MRERLAHLEYPAPKLAISTAKISVQGAGTITGTFEVINTGEGVLEGSIAASCDFLSFNPESFSGKGAKIEYTLNLEGLQGRHKTQAIITSNGGEGVLTFEIKANQRGLVTKEGIEINTLEHFHDYALAAPVAARQLFTQQDFMFWLFRSQNTSMDMYERFKADPNKERAVDNFLIFNGLKARAQVIAEQTHISHTLLPWETWVTGGVGLRRTTWGFVDAALSVAPGTEWLELTKSKITGSDFDKENFTEIDYIILPEKMRKKRDNAVVELDADPPQKILITCTSARAFTARLDRHSYRREDKGQLQLTNNTGRDLIIEIQSENFVKFEAKRYFIGKQAQIDFELKQTSQKAATSTKVRVSAITESKGRWQTVALTLRILGI